MLCIGAILKTRLGCEVVFQENKIQIYSWKKSFYISWYFWWFSFRLLFQIMPLYTWRKKLIFKYTWESQSMGLMRDVREARLDLLGRDESLHSACVHKLLYIYERSPPRKEVMLSRKNSSCTVNQNSAVWSIYL